jgi:hypothetical protein
MVKVNDATKEISLTITRPPYRPLEAIRSLLRCAWMISDADVRAQHPELLQMIAVCVQVPARYFDLSFAGANRA